MYGLRVCGLDFRLCSEINFLAAGVGIRFPRNAKVSSDTGSFRSSILMPGPVTSFRVKPSSNESFSPTSGVVRFVHVPCFVCGFSRASLLVTLLAVDDPKDFIIKILDAKGRFVFRGNESIGYFIIDLKKKVLIQYDLIGTPSSDNGAAKSDSSKELRPVETKPRSGSKRTAIKDRRALARLRLIDLRDPFERRGHSGGTNRVLTARFILPDLKFPDLIRIGLNKRRMAHRVVPAIKTMTSDQMKKRVAF